jgi:hypothetical protein
MHSCIDTKRISEVEVAGQAAYVEMFPGVDSGFISTVIGWANRWFRGGYADYQAIDAHYHDLEHTMQGFLCMIRILRNRHILGLQPVIGQRSVELGILAILMHDTGYLKHRGDKDGTGAKYTLIHVERSLAFAREFLTSRNFPEPEIRAVQNMIRCTGVNVNLSVIPFQSEGERILGHALGTSDLLGQMAAPDYVDKLPILYLEFEESSRFSGKAAAFSSADDLILKTPSFWDKFVQPKLDKDFEGLYRVLNDPYPDGRNPYIDQINNNIDRIRRERGLTAPQSSAPPSAPAAPRPAP